MANCKEHAYGRRSHPKVWLVWLPSSDATYIWGNRAGCKIASTFSRKEIKTHEWIQSRSYLGDCTSECIEGHRRPRLARIKHSRIGQETGFLGLFGLTPPKKWNLSHYSVELFVAGHIRVTYKYLTIRIIKWLLEHGESAWKKPDRTLHRNEQDNFHTSLP